MSHQDEGSRPLPQGDPLATSVVGDAAAELARTATLACLLEATVPKPGNVHRGADFNDLTFLDFVVSAAAIGPAFSQAGSQRVGQTVLAAVRATRQSVRTNTNLGIVLLLAPLAQAAARGAIADQIQATLDGLTAADAEDVYEAIRLAEPGGLGTAGRDDVRGPSPADLVAAMRLAADRDLVARQYANGFREVLSQVAPWLVEAAGRAESLAEAIEWTFLRTLALHPDSLVARKCGLAAADDISRRAAAVLASGPPGSPEYRRAVADLDFWLRADGHRRNPGTTADLIAAGLFVSLHQRQLVPPWRF